MPGDEVVGSRASVIPPCLLSSYVRFLGNNISNNHFIMLLYYDKMQTKKNTKLCKISNEDDFR